LRGRGGRGRGLFLLFGRFAIDKVVMDFLDQAGQDKAVEKAHLSAKQRSLESESSYKRPSISGTQKSTDKLPA
jgi:hypothetical protein